MKKSTTIPEAMVAGIEFYLMNGEIQFLENGVQRLFCELDVALAAKLREVMDNDPKILKGLDILGITDPIQQLMQFIYCQFGDFDKKADITPSRDLNSEYWDCGNRPCPADGFLCKLPKVINGTLTIHEAQLIREVSSDQSCKMVAAKYNRSKLTIDTQMRTIRHKLGCYTKAGICSFAGQHNLL